MIDDTGRRGFLKGVFGGITAAGLVVLASEADVAAFARVGTGAPVAVAAAPVWDGVVPGFGDTLYDAHGRKVAIVTGLRQRSVPIEVTAFGEANQVYVAGATDLIIEARAIVARRA